MLILFISSLLPLFFIYPDSRPRVFLSLGLDQTIQVHQIHLPCHFPPPYSSTSSMVLHCLILCHPLSLKHGCGSYNLSLVYSCPFSFHDFCSHANLCPVLPWQNTQTHDDLALGYLTHCVPKYHLL